MTYSRLAVSDRVGIGDDLEFSKPIRISRRWDRRRLERFVMLLAGVSLVATLFMSTLSPEVPSLLLGKLSLSQSSCGRKSIARDRFECEARHARRQFHAWTDGQSKTLKEAKRAYTMRYDRPAPVWFASWFEYARQNNVLFIDDFDQLELDMEPLRATDRRTLRTRMAEVTRQQDAEAGSLYLSLLSIRDGNARIQLPHAEGAVQAFRRILDPIMHLLPDLSILVNFGDEPYVRRSDSDLALTHTLQRLEVALDENVIASTRPCPSSNVLQLQDVKYSRLRYKTRHSICEPSQSAFLAAHHGRFQDSIREYNLTFPILSTVKGPIHEDILFPMRGYQYAMGVSPDRIPWSQKSDSLYWRGSFSGQVNGKHNWRTSHRARWVLNAQFWDRAARTLRKFNVEGKARQRLNAILLDNAQAAEMALSPSALSALERLPPGAVNVSFSNINFCLEDGGCDLLRKVTKQSPWMPGTTATEHKFVFDLDGLGMSERYYELLLSRSVVLKQTEWAEWHDEYLIPWIHYIPISLGMAEVPELLDFLINDAFGKQVAARISDEASHYVRTALSIESQSAYLLRTLYEYADIFNGR
jgi:hypothetical protein